MLIENPDLNKLPNFYKEGVVNEKTYDKWRKTLSKIE